MTQPIAAVSAVPPLVAGAASTPSTVGSIGAQGAGNPANAVSDQPGAGASAVSVGDAGFLHNINKALLGVSEAQGAAETQARALVSGAPGANLETAVVASARAKIDWNATVAVRNEVVNAYQTIMNMPI